MIPDEVIEQVRDTIDLVGMIGETVPLKRTGADYRGPCPFHGGTNRNFAVIPRKGRYYCFVCHESGDAFSWIMKRMGLSYPDAIREAGRRAGIVIPERSDRVGPDPHEPLYGALAAAHDWFTRQLLELPDARIAREYLERRQVPLEKAGFLGLGFAPQGQMFLDAMKTLGIENDVLLQAGLAAEREDGAVSARFRGRLLFPIHNLRGRVVGFGGRLLVDGEPKYLNTPETAIFHKGKQLYNLFQAKSAIRKEQTVLLVEGYFDVLRLVLAGLEHVVAPLGTALTPDQAALLKRFAPAATLLYDSDRAGLRATFRAGDELLRHSVRVRVATLPPGEDPDTLVKEKGLPALEHILNDAVDLLERKIQLMEQKGYFEGFEHRRDAIDRLLPTIRAAADPITRELYLSFASERTKVSREVLERELEAGRVPYGWGMSREAAAGYSPGPGRRPDAESIASSGRIRINPETKLVAALIAGPEWIEHARQEVAPSLFSSPRLREIYEALLQDDTASGQLPPGLSDQAAALWSRLKDAAQSLNQQDISRIYDSAGQILRARPLYRHMDALTDPGEKRRRRAELRTEFPAADAWYVYQKAASRDLRRTRDSRGA